ncbi:MAG: Cupin 2 conserved barrel domain protein [Acidobacteria bacterium]|nr:Cupin 2 conserved barrel domain protein [Acidobacteriota bacterium]
MMLPMPHTLITDLPGRAEVPEQGTLSRVLHDDGLLRLVLFAFDAGQELTEHTASVPAVLQVVSGRFRVTAGGDTIEIGPDDWLLLDAHQAHSLRAEEPSRLLLTMLRPGQG